MDTKNTNTSPPENDPQQSVLYTYARFSGFGIQLGVAFLLGIYGGKFLDARLDTRPLFLVVGAMLGMIAGFYSVFKLVTKSTPGKKNE